MDENLKNEMDRIMDESQDLDEAQKKELEQVMDEVRKADEEPVVRDEAYLADARSRRAAEIVAEEIEEQLQSQAESPEIEIIDEIPVSAINEAAREADATAKAPVEAADVMETAESDGIEKAAEAAEEAVTEAAAESASAEVEAETAPVVEAAVEELSEEVTKTGTEAVAAPKKKTKKTTIGGQALIEGIMMCGPRRTAIAVRKADGSIYVEEIKKSASETFFEKVPLVRGCIRFFRQLISGTAALMKSAEISEQGAEDAEEAKDNETNNGISAATIDAKDATTGAFEEEKAGTVEKTGAGGKSKKETSKKPSESKLDKWADKHTDGVMIFAAVLGLAFSIVLFILLPRLIVDTCLHFFSAERSDSIKLNVALNFIEGVIRIVIFLTYLGLTSKMKDIARVWMYHGAEHKTIACYEAGEDLTVENVRKQSRFHPRCGTAFLFIVVLVSILVFCVASVFIGVQVWWVNMLVRLALVPLVGGISFEILRFCGRHDKNALCKIFIAPGLALQKLTTKEPTDSMIEVAIASVQAVIPENSNEDIW